ncbi:MAG: acyltransferase [Flavobacteriales bacterium]|nr:acyltransferase [Flavobacteriales bacterium]
MYLPQLTFLRFVAAMLVVFYHYGKQTFEAGYPFLHSIIAEGSVAVSFFFFLSGVVLGINYLGKPLDVRKFWLRRLARIAPLYLLAFILTFCLQAYYFGDLPRGNAIIAQLFALHAWFPEMCLAINYPGWSISVELLFYLIFPLIATIVLAFGSVRVSIFLVVIWIGNVLIEVFLRSATTSLDVSGPFILYFPLLHIGTFAAGCVCAMLIRYMADRPEASRWSTPLLLGSVLTIAVIYTGDGPLRETAHNGGAVPAFFLLITGLALGKNKLTNILSKRPFVLLGDASYAIYLLQFPVFMLYSHGLRSASLALHEIAIYSTLLILIAIAVYLAFELPMKRKFLMWFNGSSPD